MEEPANNPSDSDTDPTETEISDKENTGKPKDKELGDAGNRNSSGLYGDFFDTGMNVGQN